MRFAAAAAVVVLAALGGCAGKKAPLTVDDLDTDIPHRSLEETCSSFPPPASDGAFVFVADVVNEATGATDGTLHVAVETGSFEDQPAWFVDEKWDDRGGPHVARGGRVTKHVRTWLAQDLGLLSAVADVESTHADGTVEKHHTEFGPTARGYWVSVTKGGASTSRDETNDAGPCWARSFAGAMVFLRRCSAESALYAGRRGDYMTVRTKDDGTMTVSGFAQMTVAARIVDRMPTSLREHVWELSPRTFRIRGTTR